MEQRRAQDCRGPKEDKKEGANTQEKGSGITSY